MIRRRCSRASYAEKVVTTRSSGEPSFPCFSGRGHLTIDDLYGRVQRQDPTVGQSTVYRTMKLLCEAWLAKEVSFGGASSGMSRPATGTTIISSASAAARGIEVVDPQIEALQERLVRQYGFTPATQAVSVRRLSGLPRWAISFKIGCNKKHSAFGKKQLTGRGGQTVYICGHKFD